MSPPRYTLFEFLTLDRDVAGLLEALSLVGGPVYIVTVLGLVRELLEGLEGRNRAQDRCLYCYGARTSARSPSPIHRRRNGDIRLLRLRLVTSRVPRTPPAPPGPTRPRLRLVVLVCLQHTLGI